MKYTVNEIACPGMHPVYCDVVKSDCGKKGCYGILFNTDFPVKEQVIPLDLLEMVDGISYTLRNAPIITTAKLMRTIVGAKEALLDFYSEQELSGLALTLFFMNDKKVVAAQIGNNRIFHIKDGSITELFTDENGIISIPALREDEGILFATDGMWMPLREEEILIDYVKSQTAGDWLAYLKTRVASRLVEDNDCFAGVAILTE